MLVHSCSFEKLNNDDCIDILKELHDPNRVSGQDRNILNQAGFAEVGKYFIYRLDAKGKVGALEAFFKEDLHQLEKAIKRKKAMGVETASKNNGQLKLGQLRNTNKAAEVRESVQRPNEQMVGWLAELLVVSTAPIFSAMATAIH